MSLKVSKKTRLQPQKQLLFQGSLQVAVLLFFLSINQKKNKPIKKLKRALPQLSIETIKSQRVLIETFTLMCLKKASRPSSQQTSPVCLQYQSIIEFNRAL
jgi:hypothetical protein